MSITSAPPPVYRPAQQPQKQCAYKPAAPPVYRPNQNPPVLRSASLIHERREIRPAPPVYRPQQSPPLQRKVSPPAYRPGVEAQVQRNSASPAPPAVYLPQAGLMQPPPVYRPARAHPQAAQPALTPPPSVTRSSSHAVVQPYFVIPSQRVFTDPKAADEAEHPAAYISGTGMFPSQAWSGQSFLAPSGESNVQAVDTPALRVSDDCELAIEDSNLKTRQPKTFFATEAALRNAKQGRTGKKYKLKRGPGQLLIWSKEGQQKMLTSVFPQNSEAPVQNPFDLKTEQSCDEVAQEVTGCDYKQIVPTCKADLPVRNVTAKSDVALAAAELVAILMNTGKGQGVKELNLSLENRNAIVSRIAQEYVNALQQGGSVLENHLQRLKLNKFADPGIGETFFISHVGTTNTQGQILDIASQQPIAPKWPYHFATVVAKSGNDAITLENYARAAEGSPASSADSRWYFQMYGQNPGQSFHEAWEATGEFANPVTMTMQPGQQWMRSKDRQERLETVRAEENRELQRRAVQAAFNRKVKIASGITIAVGLLAVALGVLHTYGMLPSLENLRFDW